MFDSVYEMWWVPWIWTRNDVDVSEISSFCNGLSPRFLKECVSVLSEPLHFILLRNHYQQLNCRIHGKIANIKPLFKKCCKTDKKNYRQISLRSLVCKLTGKIVKSRAMKFWRNIHIPFPNRFGSMAGRPTPSELLSCYDDWTKWRDGRKPTGIVFLDFSTPSDSVPHKRLLFKQERQLALTAVFFSACSF